MKRDLPDRARDPAPPRRHPSRTVAVIEIGTTAVRMVLAELAEPGGCRVLETVQQAVTLGRPVFTSGRIDAEATEQCVAVLRSFRKLLDEYAVRDDRAITAVATSAVREAENCQAFLDRLFIATGIEVTVLESADVNRLTYLAVRPHLEAQPRLCRGDTFVVEVGGGSTEVLMLRKGVVGEAHTYRLGSFRLRQTVEQYRAAGDRLAGVMERHAGREVGRIASGLPRGKSANLLALGSDARLAASLLDPSWDGKRVGRIRVSALSRLTDDVTRMSVDDVVRRYHLHYPEAETLGPALLIYTHLARALGFKEILVGSATLRGGILAELGLQGAWTQEFGRQVVASAVVLGRRYGFDEEHAEHVSQLAVQLFRRLGPLHGLGGRSEMILRLAALLHDIGQFISDASHHKHTMYLVQNSDLFGLNARDRMLVALVARYHRRSAPLPTHEPYASLARADRVEVMKLAAILRVADALDRGHVQRRRRFDVDVADGRVVIRVQNAGDLTLERHGLQEKGAMFEQVFGLTLDLSGESGSGSP